MRRRRHRMVLRALLVVGGVFALLGIAAALRVGGVARDLRNARDLLSTASVQLRDGHLADARNNLDAAEVLLLSANEALVGAPELQLVGSLPVVTQNLAAMRDAVAMALHMVVVGGEVLDASRSLETPEGDLEVPLRSGSIPLDVVANARFQLTSLELGMPPIGARPSGSFLLGPVRQLRDSVYDEVDRRSPQVRSLAAGLELLEEIAGGNGPRRYLIAVANTAEMRGTGGMWLSYGVLEGADGRFTLPAFGNIDELALPVGVDPVAASISQSELDRWPGLEPNRLWRNVNLVPDLEAVGPRVQAMYQAATGLPLDGVIQIDAQGLAALLEGTGPVTVDGLGQVDAGNVVDLTLNQAYTLFPDRDQRQEVLGDVAEAAFDRLVSGSYASLRPLAEAVARAGEERHIAMWAPSQAVASPLAFFRADGDLPDPGQGDSLFLSIQNFGRDKLDYYLDTTVAVTGARRSGERGLLEVAVTVSNTAPPGVREPAYVFGDQGRPGEPGTYRGIASLYLPTGARVEAAAGGDDAPTLLREGDRTVAGFDVEVPAGGSQQVRFRVVLPARPDGYELAIFPLPRVRPTVWDVDVDAGEDRRLTRVGPLLTPTFITSTT